MDVIDYYDRHPISEAHALEALRRARGGILGSVTADDLFAFDQDHYGGLAAVDALATRAAIGHHSHVLDLCAGLGGPARFLASRRQCRVVGLELNAGRARGMARLTRLVRLHDRVRVVRGDARALPFGRGRFDACVSQEALLHIPDKGAVLREVRRVLAPGGRLVFTDWIAHPALSDGERRRLHDWMAATTLQSLDGYRQLLGRAGFRTIEAEDLTGQWRPIVARRLAAFRARREETAGRLGEQAYADHETLQAFFVGLVETGRLGGGRFSATA